MRSTSEQATHLDTIADLALEMTGDELAEFAAGLTEDEIDLLEVAINRRVEAGWRSDPLEMAHELTKGTPGEVRRWRYMKLLARRFVMAVEGEARRQIWMLPARYGKTLMASVWGPTWALDRYPELPIMELSYAAKLARRNAVTVRDIAEEHAERLRFRLKPGAQRADLWQTTEGGGILAAGVDGGTTGFGGGLIVIDDPFKDWKEAHSETTRENVWNWYRSVVYLRLNQETDSIIVVGTRWHEDDLVGRLLNPPDGEEPEPWLVTRLPATAEDGDDDPLGRAPGEVIEEERFSTNAVRARARVLGSYLTAAMEQQRPAPAEGSILLRQWWRYWRSLPNPLELEDWFTSWDMAFKDAADSSYVVGQVWCRHGANRYLVDQVRDRMDFPTTLRAVQTFAAKHPKATKHLVEDKANGPAVISMLRAVLPGLVPRSPGQDSKESRARAHSAVVEAGNVWLPDPGFDDAFADAFSDAPPALALDRGWVHGFVDECAAFPNASHDDQVDAWSQAMQEYAGFFDDQVETTARDPRAVLRGRR